MRLTKANVGRLTIPDGKTESIVFDEAMAGFGVRLRAGGKRTWIAQYRLGNKQRRLTLGTVETLDESEARRRAKTALTKFILATIRKWRNPSDGRRRLSLLAASPTLT